MTIVHSFISIQGKLNTWWIYSHRAVAGKVMFWGETLQRTVAIKIQLLLEPNRT